MPFGDKKLPFDCYLGYNGHEYEGICVDLDLHVTAPSKALLSLEMRRAMRVKMAHLATIEDPAKRQRLMETSMPFKRIIPFMLRAYWHSWFRRKPQPMPPA